ncbi:tail assembly chaperone [Alkalihalobacillus pseudalcaliphilus]|uniref:tail assembly chaperone n=1 Tax=Alkalihalobacillus pseudalcaliphilus TaxID=79884 RepID=UPI00064DCE5E|nr:tail assembly chaperone [Alkalihalobacillus pseudalcaliphilus]KMK75458.1 hypothetical protein AB990_09115 [Alkalihalobacillus pseudalcaliphilus]
MATFEIEGKEYELKLTYASVKYLDKHSENGQMGLVGLAMMGDLDIFPHIVHAGLFHAKQNFTLAHIEAEIEKAFEAEKLDLDGIIKLSNEVVTKSFFYKKTVDKFMKLSGDPKATEALAKLTE